MEKNDDEKRYRSVTKNLNQLKKINPPAYFEADLFRKINSGNFKEEKLNSARFLSPGKLIPSAVIIAVAVIVLFMIKTNPIKQDDPLSVNPPLREGIRSVNQNDAISAGDIAKKELNENINKKRHDKKLESHSGVKTIASGKSNPKSPIIPEISSQQANNSTRPAIAGISLSPDSSIKEGLNYKQANLTKSQKKEVTILKHKMEKMYKKDKK